MGYIVDWMRQQRMSRAQRERLQAQQFVLLTFKSSVVWTLAVSGFMLRGGIDYLASKYNMPTVCSGVHHLLWPMFAISFLLLVIFTLGCCSFGRNDRPLFEGLYLLGLLLVIICLLVFVIFGYVAVYGGWLRGGMDDPHYWATTSACLRHKDACKRITEPELDPVDPGTGVLVPMPIESGCCMPPSSCPFTYVNGTWTPTPGAPAAESNVECSRWGNDPQTLCFQCDSCKAGLLDEIKEGWNANAASSAIFTLILLIISLPCQGQGMNVDLTTDPPLLA